MALETVQAPGPVKPAPWITEAGVYDLNDTQYHGDPVVGGSLSSTGARAILPPNGSPARFRYDQLFGRADTRAFDVGRAAHREVLGVGDEIEVIEGSGSDVNSWRTNDDRAAVQAARDAGKTPVTPRDARMVKAMAEALRAHPVAGPLFAQPGMVETSFVAPDERTGVWRRVRADWCPDGRKLVVDYKTTKSAEPGRFARAVAEYGYHQQGAFYVDVLRSLDMLDADAEFVLVAQEKVPPYLVSIGTLSGSALYWGRVLNGKALALYRECAESGLWPGYPTESVTLDLPGYLVAEYESVYGAGPGELTSVPPSLPRPTFAGQVFDTVKTGHETARLREAIGRCESRRELLGLREANRHMWCDELDAAGGERFAQLPEEQAVAS